MPFENLSGSHFDNAEKAAVTAAIETIENAVSAKLKNLSPEERQKYGSINEQNKLIVNKIKDFHAMQPNLSSPDVDWTEFLKDYESREFIAATITKLQNLVDGLTNNKILHDFDNYQAALTDYDYAKYKLGTNKAGFESKVSEISQFFNRTGTTVSKTNQNETDTP
jgi:hypothetical protein